MVDINTAANIAEISGGIAILVSLIYVGYQVRQSNRIASASALQSVLESYANRTLAYYIDHPEIMDVLTFGHHSADGLSPENQTIFNAWSNSDIFQLQNVKQFHGHGLINQVEYETWLAFIGAQMKTPGGSKCWQRQKVSYSPTIVEAIDTYLANNPSAPSIIDLYPDVYGDAAYVRAKEKLSGQ
jgi:hypothetical protein